MTEIEVAADLYLLLAALGLALSVDYAGLPLLGQSAFVAVGGFGTAILVEHGVPLLIAVATSVAIATVSGYVLALGAIRLAGAALALATWALAWLAQSVLVAFPRVSGGSQGRTLPIPARLVSPSLGSTVTLTTTVHLVVAAVLCAGVLAALARIDRGPLGLDLAALRGGPGLAELLGVRVGARRRTVVAVTAGLGALGGAGGAVLLGSIAPADVSPLLAVQLFVAVLLGAGWRPWGTLVGFAVVATLPHVSDAIASATGARAELVRGAGTAILLVVALAVRGPAARLLTRLVPSRPPRVPPPQSIPLHPPARAGESVVVARGVRVDFSGVRALAGADLELRAGEVHALVGPNGSGKTTLLRVLSGARRPDGGTIEIAGRAASGGPARAVAAGVVRTPQATLLPAGLTPLRQAAVGAGAAAPGRFGGLRHLVATPSSAPAERTRLARAAAALALVEVPAATGMLDAGAERLLQVGRAVATGARVLLLDEPAAGTTPAERRQLAVALRRLADAGAAVCIVEHDMRFVASVADRVTVLAGGQVLASGTAEAIRNDEAVRRVYLGAEPIG